MCFGSGERDPEYDRPCRRGYALTRRIPYVTATKTDTEMAIGADTGAGTGVGTEVGTVILSRPSTDWLVTKHERRALWSLERYDILLRNGRPKVLASYLRVRASPESILQPSHGKGPLAPPVPLAAVVRLAAARAARAGHEPQVIRWGKSTRLPMPTRNPAGGSIGTRNGAATHESRE
ncbi:hypothetical protein PCL_09766 [Purpureocillium lilacinum]|uniref:Uncharacterized protein n=1 Tax=Purpureocillium lilacinum TaxID=33203 RepID=A0A2U3EE02_PURLI|nr:hypothetical protein PCL_09766 [Purpureocillium lilacinum]